MTESTRRIDGVCFVRTWSDGTGQLTYWCPGCESGHTVTWGGAETWTWDGDCDKPTITPSVLVWPHGTFVDPDLDGAALMAESNKTMTPRCHSFVVGGRIQYLDDCDHLLAGQTVDMVPLPARYARFLED